MFVRAFRLVVCSIVFATALYGQSTAINEVMSSNGVVKSTPITRDMSHGRQPDGTGDWRLFTEPTPGAPGAGSAFDSHLEPVRPSHGSGFYATSVNVSLSHPDELATIHYTLDGSLPDAGAAIYDGPITIDSRDGAPNLFSDIPTSTIWNAPARSVPKATILRAVAVRPGFIDGEVTTTTYFVGDGLHTTSTLPIFSIATEPEHFFDYESGIYVPGRIYDEQSSLDLEWWQQPGNYSQRGQEWERPIHLDIFESDGEHTTAIGAGARIHGGATRTYPMKSLRLYFRAEYDEANRLDQPIFVEQERRNYKRLILRTSGNDAFNTLIRDVTMQRLVAPSDIETQDARTVLLYVNGEFWGIHHVRERFDHRYIENVYDVPRDQVDMLELDSSPEYGNADHYLTMMDHIRASDMSSPDVLEKVETMMDVDDFIQYQVSQIYFDNTDWPGNNVRFWRKRTPGYDSQAPPGHDGRWRWMLYDTDFGFGLSNRAPSSNTLAYALSPQQTGTNPPWSTELVRSLAENEEFRHRFINTFSDKLNTVFRPNRVLAVVDSMATLIEDVVPHHVDRWRRPWSVAGWRSEVDVMRHWAVVRPDHQWQHLVDQFDLAGTSEITVNIEGAGRLQVNSVVIDHSTIGIEDDASPYPWSGRYANGIPLRIVAEPAPSYRLVGWQGLDVAPDDTIVVELTTDTELSALFERVNEHEPAPHSLADGPYDFSSWSPDEPAGTYPENMVFLQTRVKDPDLDENAPDSYQLPYNLDARTRIVGLDDAGFAFINTGANDEWLEGAEGRDLGEAILGISTLDARDITVAWRGSTVWPNDRVYAIRLQYRVSDHGPFRDVLDDQGQPVEYARSGQVGHSETFVGTLPQVAEDQPYIQLRWKYYHRAGDSGPRAMLSVSDLHVSARSATASQPHDQPETTCPLENYPNPFDHSTTIRFCLQNATDVAIHVYNVLGQRVDTVVDANLSTGSHSVEWKPGNRANGTYIYRMLTRDFMESRAMTLIR